jgi:hypothetical protein
MISITPASSGDGPALAGLLARATPARKPFYAELGLPKHPSKIFYRVQDTGAGFPGFRRSGFA